MALVIGVLQAAYLDSAQKARHHAVGKLGAALWCFGGATILLHDARFIMWKPTLLFWVGALVLLASHLMGKNGLKAMMGKEITLPEGVWRSLTFAWLAFLVLMGLVNLFVAYTFTEAPMGKLPKLFGSTALMIVFFIAQGTVF